MAESRELLDGLIVLDHIGPLSGRIYLRQTRVLLGDGQ